MYHKTNKYLLGYTNALAFPRSHIFKFNICTKGIQIVKKIQKQKNTKTNKNKNKCDQMIYSVLDIILHIVSFM